MHSVMHAWPKHATKTQNIWLEYAALINFRHLKGGGTVLERVDQFDSLLGVLIKCTVFFKGTGFYYSRGGGEEE